MFLKAIKLLIMEQPHMLEKRLKETPQKIEKSNFNTKSRHKYLMTARLFSGQNIQIVRCFWITLLKYTFYVANI